MTNQFAVQLAKCHHSVNALLAIHNRSTEFLCVALADVYALLRKARQNPEAFIEVARADFNVKVTGAAADPLALVSVKVGFHNVTKEYDLRKSLNTWSLAIARMDSLDVPVELAAKYLQDTGIVNSAAAHRKALNRNDEGRKLTEHRRTETYVASLPKIGSATKFFDGEQVTTINTANDQESLRALAQQPGRVLLLGEIDEQFNLKVVGVVERDATEIARFLARKARSNSQEHNQCQPAITELSAVNDNEVAQEIHISDEEAA
jgi:hypothetical protein